MPELTAGGPKIPVRLLNELDDGKVVFFCGAGVSAGAGSGLPNFEDLVQHVYEAHRIEPDAIEKEALDLRAPDKALGLLEREERLGAHALRRTVIKRLSARPSGELSVHKALLELSRSEKGVRLVTTNFDNRFFEAGPDGALVDAAPKLPAPKRHAWSSLVHLHGRIAEHEDGSSLVLTAADFGRAYLTERWAARFVTELFREFTVVFVGYSIDDPVMSYMVDALAAERVQGARFEAAYAFAGVDGPDAGKPKASDGWRAKSVEPIVFDRKDDYRLLAETLIAWAGVRKDPFHARSRIAINEMANMPAGPEDPVAERVVWALEDAVAAKALADEPPVVDEGEFGKLEKWLDIFSERGLLRCNAGEVGPGGPDQNPAIVRLVDKGLRLENPDNLDQTRVNLSVWLARHLHVPQVFAWAIRNGGHLHPRLRKEVQKGLIAENPNIRARLRILWTVLLGSRPADPWNGLWSKSRYAAATSESERRRIEDDVIESIAPRLIARPGPPFKLKLRQHLDKTPLQPIDECGHLKMVSGEDDSWRWVKEALQGREVLSRHAETLTGHLEKALGLGEDDDDGYSASFSYRPSISEHEQNYDYEGWTHLIDLVRDSQLALAAAKRRQGENLLLRWIESGRPLFRRLALNALAEDTKSDIRLARNLLLTGRKPGLWELELRREVMRFFRCAGKRLPRDLRAAIARAVHAGPKPSKGKTPPNHKKEAICREKELLLHKLSVSGARLDKKSRALADRAEATVGDERDEFPLWRNWVHWDGDGESAAPRELVEGSVTDVAAALDGEKVGQGGLRRLVAKKRVKVASALRRLARQDKWPASCWQELLWHLAGPHAGNGPPTRLHAHVAGILVEAPDELFNEIGPAGAGFVRRLAEECGIDREAEFGLLWTKAWICKGAVGPKTVDMGDPLTDALHHPAGKLAEAAVMRLRKHEPLSRAGMHAAVRPYFEAIAEDPDGHSGRVMLATWLHYLFVIDPDWTADRMIARLDPGQSPEAGNLWFAYGWSSSLGPDLLRAFKGPFLEILRNGGSDGRRPCNLMDLFITVCLEAPGELTEPEIHEVVDALPEKALETLLGSLRQRLAGEATERGRIWRDKVHPWLRDYWPKAAVQNTAGTSEAILEMLAECGDAFPQAAEWSLEYLRPLEGQALYRLGGSNHAAQHPDAMLLVLDRAVNADVLPEHQRYPLHKILDALVETKAEMASDPRFRKLYQIATQ